MKVGELRHLVAGLPDDIEVMLIVEDGDEAKLKEATASSVLFPTRRPEPRVLVVEEVW